MNHPQAKEKIYFKGLNGIRAIAAIGVVIGHVLYILDHSFIVNYAHAAVIVFFTLSGFLITYLLLQEKEQTEKISLKNFYLRRILRIWPLYFFYIGIIILLHYYIIGDGIKNINNIKYFFLFLQNYCVYFLQRQPTDMGHLWSIGVEEQFYFVWPIIFLFTKNLKKFLFGFILSILFIRGVLKIYCDYTGNLTPFYFSSSCAYDSIATGALFSYFYKLRNETSIRYAKSFLVPLAF
ncbi:MAG: acyltransferase, partial [Bacteroidetes bacterium]|nr:acyltransferase [Bacteroidota bacterium]